MDLIQITSLVDETKQLVIESGAMNKCSVFLQEYWPGCRPLLVADTNTWNAAGKTLSQKLETAGIAPLDSIIFKVPPFLLSDYENTELIVDRAKQLDDVVLVAIGSGTINDLVKRAAFETGNAYLCVGTAASMDGYCSSGAALSKNGRKQTMECPAPRVVLADTDILKKAPASASAAGYGDLASKITAGADWIIADFTGDDPIDEQVWNIVQPNLNRWLADPENLAEVFEGLNVSGLAMQVLGRSRAASGAEHLLSHIWEMSGHLGADGNPVSHGFQVSIGILCVTALMQEVFSLQADEIDIDAAVEAYPDWDERAVEIEKLMSSLPSWTEYPEICRQKHLKKDELRQKLGKIKKDWEILKAGVKKKLPDYDQMRQMLKSAGCPVNPEDINMSRTTAVSAFAKAQCMRNRYTVLDLAYELGVFSKCIDEVKNNNQYLN